MSRARICLLALLACLGSACKSKESPAAEGAAKAKTFAVIPKGTTHEYWKSVHAGARKAARELGVEIIWKGPVREDDRDEQIKVVETFLARGVDGIVLAPLDDRALLPVLNDAKARKVPVLIIDSNVQWDGYVSYVATDNEKAGGLAATKLGTLLGGKGRVLVMRYQTGSASTSERENGFLATLRKDFPNIQVVSDNQYGGATTETAFATGENLLSTHKELDGIFCPNESTTFGMLRALSAAGRAGKLRFFGFDASPKLVEALQKGEIDGLVVQNPMRMGETAVRSLVALGQNKSVDKRVDTGAVLVTRDNMSEPAVRELLAEQRRVLAAAESVATPDLDWLRNLERINTEIDRVWGP
ncbi:MAG TPA: substrate-binding domain-containing protein, partial [Polyangiales bacterium]